MRIRGSVAAFPPLGIVGTPHPGEDLAPLRVVPVAEARPRDDLVGDPRAAPEDPMLVAEEDLRVLGVRKGAEPRVPLEMRRRPLPDGALHVLELVAGHTGCLLPLRLARQPLARPAGVGVCF